MTSNTENWLSKRNRGIHMTIRDVDCRNFDVAALIQTFAEWRVTFFTFFAAGYVTTYPTALSLQRVSPWLDGRDLTGEIVEEAHRHGIRALPMIDLGQLPEAAYLAHPEWAAADAAGNPVQAADGPLYRACPLGGYIQDYSRDVVAELCARYEIDGMKFGGGSYGFGTPICHCPACKEQYPKDTGHPLPTHVDWEDGAWQRYVRWKGRKTAQTVRHLVDMVHAVQPGLPVVGNAVCFGDPGWTLRASLDIEELASIEDIVQVEVQTRLRQNSEGTAKDWQFLRWPAETARYMTSVSERPIWTVCSYFLAWPWRRSAVPAPEQTVYLAQMAAHGATPMVNLSGGPPQAHEDTRGFQAIRDVYGFMADHEELYKDDASAAKVALVYSQESLVHYGGDQAHARYVDDVRGFELALDQAHIPYDILSCRVLDEETLAPYAALVLPSAVYLSDRVAATLERFLDRGGSLIADLSPGLYDLQGRKREGLALASLLGIEPTGEPAPALGASTEYTQGYMRQQSHGHGPPHPVTRSNADLELLPLLGRFLPVRAAAGATVPYRRAAPFRVFPEGWSYTTKADPGEPMVVALDKPGRGRTVFFAPQIGKLFYATRYPPLGDLIADAVRWAAGDAMPIEVDAPDTLHTSPRRLADGRLAVHCINLTGGERFFSQIVPLHDCQIRVRMPQNSHVTATQVSTQAGLTVAQDGEWWTCAVPKLDRYDVILFEGTPREEP